MNWILVGDFPPFTVPPSDAADAVAPSAKVCSIPRANAGL
jgi:hypothetical protein